MKANRNISDEPKQKNKNRTLTKSRSSAEIYKLLVAVKIRNMKNPIKDNRIVKDNTFALRLLSFALDTKCADACGEDEKESMVSYSTSLLKYQIETATDHSEIDYLIRCNAKERLKEGLRFLGIY